jgi:hypothetical protein
MCNSVISDCRYNLWVVNKTNYQSERRLQSPKHVTIYICIHMCVFFTPCTCTIFVTLIVFDKFLKVQIDI